MDDYDEIVAMLQKIKGNSKALAYIKHFIKDILSKCC